MVDDVRHSDIPWRWEDQRRKFGFPAIG